MLAIPIYDIWTTKKFFQYRALFSKRPDPKPLYVKEFSCWLEKNVAMKQGRLLKVDRRRRGDITAVIKYIKGCRKKEGSNLFSTSRLDRIKITALSHNKKHSPFTRKKKIIVSSKALDYATKGSSSLSPHLQKSYPDNSEEWLRQVWLCLGTGSPFCASLLATLSCPLFQIAAAGFRMRNHKFSRGHEHLSLLCFLRNVMSDNNAAISITLMPECRKRMIIYGKKEVLESTATRNKWENLCRPLVFNLRSTHLGLEYMYPVYGLQQASSQTLEIRCKNGVYT